MGNCVAGNKIGGLGAEELAKFKTLIHEKEYNLLKMIYFDLGARHPSHELTIQNFLLFFHKNGYWGNRLFKEFDSNKSNLISEQEFIKGIIRIFKTTEQQKIELLYKFFSDGNREKGVHYNEFLTMLYNYPKEEIKVILNDEDFINKELRSKLIAIDSDFQGHRYDSVCPGDILNAKVSKAKFKLEDNDSSDRMESKMCKDFLQAVGKKPTQRTMTALKLKVGKNDVEVQTASIHNIVKKFAKTIFKEYKIDTKTGTLKLKDFTDWMLKHKKLYDGYYDGFHNQIWQVDRGTQKPLFVNRKPDFLSKAKLDLASIKGKQVMLILLHSILIVSEQNDLQNPILIICLEGLATKQIYKENYGHGIEISHRQGIYQARTFYFRNQELQKQWMTHLKYYKGASISQLYDMGDKIGIGKFSIVYSCKQKATGQIFAIKVIESYKLNEEQRRIIAHESGIMSILSHPLMVSLKKSIQTKTHIYIITELVKGKDLFELICDFKYLGEKQSAYIIKQIIIGVRYLHSLGIVHRDLKPENIMVEYDRKKGELGKIRVIDFGFANYLKTVLEFHNHQNPQVKRQILAGTPNYIAPELLYASQGEPAEITEKMDNFSIGSILYMMLCGTPPFESESTGEILRRTMEGSFVLSDKRWKKVSNQAKKLVTALLEVEPKDRISLQDALKHPWIQQMGQDNTQNHIISFQLKK